MAPSSLTVVFLILDYFIPLFGVLHVTILAGGFLIAILGTLVMALALLVLLKTAIDVRAHLKEHRKAEITLEEASANDWSAWTKR